MTSGNHHWSGFDARDETLTSSQRNKNKASFEVSIQTEQPDMVDVGTQVETDGPIGIAGINNQTEVDPSLVNESSAAAREMTTNQPTTTGNILSPIVESQDISRQCDHYKRLCRVKFSCCQRYFPCHRCHNEAVMCSRNDIEAKDATFMECSACGSEQEITVLSQFCGKCDKMFAEYFCYRCKHWTGGQQRSPYHCNRCNICWNILCYCDDCGIYLDNYLLDRHECFQEQLAVEVTAFFDESVGSIRGCPTCKNPLVTLSAV